MLAVHVDVDFMGPFVSQVKKASKDVWMQLPPPVRQAAPYVGASVGTGLLVYRIQQHRLNNAVSQIVSNHIYLGMSVAAVANVLNVLRYCRTPRMINSSSGLSC